LTFRSLSTVPPAQANLRTVTIDSSHAPSFCSILLPTKWGVTAEVYSRVWAQAGLQCPLSSSPNGAQNRFVILTGRSASEILGRRIFGPFGLLDSWHTVPIGRSSPAYFFRMHTNSGTVVLKRRRSQPAVCFSAGFEYDSIDGSLRLPGGGQIGQATHSYRG
jgi:hypothetical protein